jgi:hypothetical protein
LSLQDNRWGRLLDFLEEKVSGKIQLSYILRIMRNAGRLGLFFKGVIYNGSVKVPIMISYHVKLPQGVYPTNWLYSGYTSRL